MGEPQVRVTTVTPLTLALEAARSPQEPLMTAV
ncbi:MAG: hypothetical protein JWR42_129, partial [Marmoricola sp.]|nr:hypothetical protein [Marmoricola sp.]